MIPAKSPHSACRALPSRSGSAQITPALKFVYIILDVILENDFTKVQRTIIESSSYFLNNQGQGVRICLGRCDCTPRQFSALT